MIIVYAWHPKDIPTAVNSIAHLAVAFTGLGSRSFYIDWDGGRTPQFHTTDYHYADKHYGKPTRIPLVSQEDGNGLGLSEYAALKWWEIYKQGHRFNTFSNDCSRVTLKALIAAGAQRIDAGIREPAPCRCNTVDVFNMVLQLRNVLEEKIPNPILGCVIEDFNTKNRVTTSKNSLDAVGNFRKFRTLEYHEENEGDSHKIHRQALGYKFRPWDDVEK